MEAKTKELVKQAVKITESLDSNKKTSIEKAASALVALTSVVVAVAVELSARMEVEDSVSKVMRQK